MRIYFGPAGNIAESALASVRRLKELDLHAMEFAFTYSVWMKDEDAVKIKEENKKLKLRLSAHAQYWINLNSKEKDKIEASKKRIIDACSKVHLFGGRHVVFHPGFYGDFSRKETYERIKEALLDLKDRIKEKGWSKVRLTCETTGKKSQFGSVEELKQLKEEAGTEICVDFAHLYARNLGAKNYDQIVKDFKGARDLHCHFSGIEYGPRGEKRHLVMKETDIRNLLKALKKYKVSCTIISESPITYKDSLKMKRIWQKIR